VADAAQLPRSAWLAVGGLVAALALEAGGKAPLVAAGLAGGAVATLAISRPARAHLPRTSPAARIATLASPLSLGILLLVARAALAGGLGPAPTASSGLGQDQTDGSGRWTATVISVGSPKAAEQIALIRLSSGPAVALEALLPRYPEVGPGDLITVSGRVQPAGTDDYGAYLGQIGAAGTLRSPILERLSGPTGPAGILDSIRLGSATALARALPEPQAGLASGILIGLRDRVDRDLAAAFTTAGVSHIVAISGWNIAIVAAVVGALVSGLGRTTRTVVTLAAIVGYTLVAGASPSVDRAALMAAIGLTARAGGRSGPALGALGWAVVGLLLFDPGTVSDPGFELSGLATAGLIAWSTPLSGQLSQIAIAGRGLPGWLSESLAISLAAEASTLPIVLLTFGRVALVAPLANLVIVPLVPAAMAAGGLALAAGWLGAAGLPQAIVTSLGLPAWAILGLLIWLVHAAAGLPFASVVLPAPWNVAAAGAALAGVATAAAGGSLAARLGGPIRSMSRAG
jgi:competence protein ComEC